MELFIDHMVRKYGRKLSPTCNIAGTQMNTVGQSTSQAVSPSSPASRQIPKKQPNTNANFGNRPVAPHSVSNPLLSRHLTPAEPTSPSFSSNVISQCESVAGWMIANRLGLSKLVGCRLISAQYRYLFSAMAHFPATSQAIIDSACATTHEDGFRTEKITLAGDATTLCGVICYPAGRQSTPSSDLIIFNNMNGTTISNFFDKDRLASTSQELSDGEPTETPGNIQRILGCPILLYDYTGTGINKRAGLLRHAPAATGETAIKDAMAVLHTALNQPGIDNITLMGSSLGGGVATVALERYLSNLGEDEATRTKKRLTLVNHDSYSTTSRVVIPQFPQFADTLGWLCGAHIDAATPMKKLVGYHKVNTIILSRESDPTIRKGSRMYEMFANASAKESHLSWHHSGLPGHSGLSEDQTAFLRRTMRGSPEKESSV